MDERTNITLSLPSELMLRLKHRAVDAGSSVSQFVRGLVEAALAEDDPYEKAWKRQTVTMQKGFSMGLDDWKKPSRDELHER
ncbi:MAG: ribbon-helix-helix protein, CopG family [Candidatus Eremiobacteraeota bacterium]|nr:ribbon-helix-helix protein, CopG family [Candidatus Eremiobacteraeota bacterium]